MSKVLKGEAALMNLWLRLVLQLSKLLRKMKLRIEVNRCSF